MNSLKELGFYVSFENEINKTIGSRFTIVVLLRMLVAIIWFKSWNRDKVGSRQSEMLFYDRCAREKEAIIIICEYTRGLCNIFISKFCAKLLSLKSSLFIIHVIHVEIYWISVIVCSKSFRFTNSTDFVFIRRSPLARAKSKVEDWNFNIKI